DRLRRQSRAAVHGNAQTSAGRAKAAGAAIAAEVGAGLGRVARWCSDLTEPERERRNGPALTVGSGAGAGATERGRLRRSRAAAQRSPRLKIKRPARAGAEACDGRAAEPRAALLGDPLQVHRLAAARDDLDAVRLRLRQPRQPVQLAQRVLVLVVGGLPVQI